MDGGETIGIAGAGAFGLSLAQLLASAGRDVLVWSQDQTLVADINARHRADARMPDVVFNAGVVATGDPAHLATAAPLIVFAVGSTGIRARARLLGDHLDGHHVLVHAVGALSPVDDQRISDILKAETPVRRVGVLAGPALPSDLVGGRFASMVVASPFANVATQAREWLAVPPKLRIYRTTDMVGVELSSALASAYIISLGIAAALEIGSGPQAVLVTRIVAEASRLVVAAGGDEKTFAGLGGLGNLLVRSSTDSSAPSFILGAALVRGECANEFDTEGTRAVMAGLRLADRYGVRAPVLSAIGAVLRGELSPVEAAHRAADTVAAEE